jgi:hypothetical protein
VGMAGGEGQQQREKLASLQATKHASIAAAA